MTVTIDLTDAEVRTLKGCMIRREEWTDWDWKYASEGDLILHRLWDAIQKKEK